MRWIVGSSLRFRFLVVAAAAALDVVRRRASSRTRRWTSSRSSRRRASRSRRPAWGCRPREVEELVTVPLEEPLNGIEGLDEMRSKSVPQLSSIQLIFKRGTDVLQGPPARAGAPGHGHADAADLGGAAVHDAAAVGDEPDHEDRPDVEGRRPDRAVDDRLLEDPGAAAARPRRGQRRDLGRAAAGRTHVQVDPAKLAAQTVTLDRVMEATVRRARRRPAAVLRRRGRRHRRVRRDAEPAAQHPRTSLPIVTPEDLAQVPVAPPRRTPTLRLGDIGDVVEDHQPLIGDAVINDGPGLLLVVEKCRGANTLEVTRGVEDALKDLQPGLPGVDDRHDDLPARRPSSSIAIDNLTTRAALGFLLVILVLIAFLFEWRTALISLIAIPLSLVAAGARARPARRDDQHDGARRAGDRDRRGRRRRDHRRGEHRPAAAAVRAARGAPEPLTRIDPGGVARGAQRDRVRDPDHRRRRGARCFFLQGLTGSFFRPLALSYALAVAGVDARRADRHPGACA